MQLKAVRVQMFRNIVDSGEVAIEPDVTCLVGKNESGKTALLSAIYRAKPVHQGDTFDVTKHYPRWRLSRDRRDRRVEGIQPIECVYELEESDAQAVEDVLGPDVLQTQTFMTSRGYSGPGAANLEVDNRLACDALFRAAGSPTALQEVFVGLDEPAEIAKVAASLEPPDGGAFTTEQLAALKDEAATRVGTGTVWQTAVRILSDRQPQFFYFGDYQTLPGRIDVRALGGSDLLGTTPLQTARALLELAGTTAEALTEENFEERKAELEAVSNELTEEVFKYWTQNAELSVEIDMDKVSETGSSHPPNPDFSRCLVTGPGHCPAPALAHTGRRRYEHPGLRGSYGHRSGGHRPRRRLTIRRHQTVEPQRPRTAGPQALASHRQLH